ncbi:MAG: hypothetical protein C0399_11110 [Syntrophus sp. (in: bacteria)]|nr:hypothetical protein [Syntrophus sp. (in: bacteria)]
MLLAKGQCLLYNDGVQPIAEKSGSGMSNNKNKIDLNSIKIRRTYINDDINIIIDISRACFPGSLKWNALKYSAKKRWQYILTSQYVEVYIVLLNDIVAGFFILATDIPSYNKEKEKEKLQYLFLRMLSIVTLILKPYLIMPSLKKLHKIIFYKRPSMISDRITDHKTTQDKIAWAELTGIGIQYRGKGLLTIMHEFMVARCLELGKEAIGSLIDPNNLLVARSRKSLHFVKTGESRYGHTYIKYLSHPQ